MATYNPNSLSPDELSCPICFEEFTTQASSEHLPKLLLCLHTFCLGCVRSLVKSNKSVQCSICRTEHADVSPQELFDNYIIIDYVRKQQEESDALLARQHSELFMSERSEEPGYRLRQDQVHRDAELARQFQQFYDGGGEDASHVPNSAPVAAAAPAAVCRSSPTMSLVQQPEVLCLAQEELQPPPRPPKPSQDRANIGRRQISARRFTSLKPSCSNLPSTQPSLSNLPSTQPSHSNRPCTQPSSSNLPTTQPIASNISQTQPTSSNFPSTQSAVFNLPSSQPTSSYFPSSQPVAQLQQTSSTASVYSNDDGDGTSSTEPSSSSSSSNNNTDHSSCSEDRCSSQASVSSRLDDELVDTVQTVAGGSSVGVDEQATDVDIREVFGLNKYSEETNRSRLRVPLSCYTHLTQTDDSPVFFVDRVDEYIPPHRRQKMDPTHRRASTAAGTSGYRAPLVDVSSAAQEQKEASSSSSMSALSAELTNTSSFSDEDQQRSSDGGSHQEQVLFEGDSNDVHDGESSASHLTDADSHESDIIQHESDMDDENLFLTGQYGEEDFDHGVDDEEDEEEEDGLEVEDDDELFDNLSGLEDASSNHSNSNGGEDDSQSLQAGAGGSSRQAPSLLRDTDVNTLLSNQDSNEPELPNELPYRVQMNLVSPSSSSSRSPAAGSSADGDGSRSHVSISSDSCSEDDDDSTNDSHDDGGRHDDDDHIVIEDDGNSSTSTITIDDSNNSSSNAVAINNAWNSNQASDSSSASVKMLEDQ